jgi:hypothetical protein
MTGLHLGAYGEGGDECLSDRLLRVNDAKRTASKEINAQTLALISDRYDDFCALSVISGGPGRRKKT